MTRSLDTSKIVFFLMQTNQVKTCAFCLVHNLPACNKKAEILPLASALVAHLRSQFNHVFALLVSTPRF